MLVLNLPAFEQPMTGNGPYGEILTKNDAIRTLGLTLPYNKVHYPVLSVKK